MGDEDLEIIPSLGSDQMKYVIITGSVVSGIGKGITSSSIGVLLQPCLTNGVTSIKIDPYFNYDASLMSPQEHGEVYVLNDGGETDLDLGNYERFLDHPNLTADHNITAGKIYSHVLRAERRGDMLGKTVQMHPHVTNAVVAWIKRVAHIPCVQPVSTEPKTATSDSKNSTSDSKNESTPQAPAPDVCLIELGGTIGDMEVLLFLEALRQLKCEVGSENVAIVHVSLVPAVGASQEQKTKPVQNGVRELRKAGLSPDFVVCRSEKPLHVDARNKIANFAMVDPARIISLHDVANIYQVPLLLRDQGVAPLLLKQLQLPFPLAGWTGPALKEWEALSHALDRSDRPLVRIALVGKYVDANDAYLSVSHALRHAAMASECRLQIDWIDSELLQSQSDGISHANPALACNATAFTGTIPRLGACPELESKDANGARAKKTETDIKKRRNAWELLKSAHGILVPGGFGSRGTEGMIAAIKFAREKKIPFLGICLGLQMAVIEFCRNRLGMAGATSAEFSEEAPVFAMNDLYAKALEEGAKVDTKTAFCDRFKQILQEREAETRALTWFSKFPSFTEDVKAGPIQPPPSKEDKPKVAVISLMLEKTSAGLGGTMRCGSRRTNLTANSLASVVYGGQPFVYERHRHRYEGVPALMAVLTKGGLCVSGVAAQHGDDRETRCEIVELAPDEHPFFMAVQFHPEYQSRPLRPSPPFLALLRSSLARAS